MKISLRAVLEQWSLYKRASEEIQGYLMEGQYSISRLRLLTGSPEAVLVQVETLEVLEVLLSLSSKRTLNASKLVLGFRF